MELQVREVNEKNFWEITQLKSDRNQEERIQIFERWVGSNVFFLSTCHVYGFTPKAIYDKDTLIGFTCHGYRKEHERYELISFMIGHKFQGKGYGVHVLQSIIDDMINMYDCKKIYLSVIFNNDRAIRLYEKLGFKPTGEIEQGHHPEPVYCLVINE